MNEEKFKRVTRILKYADTHPFDDDFIKDYIQSIIKENEKLKNDKMELLKMIDNLEKQKKELRNWVEKMLDYENDIFSVVRVKDVLSMLNKLEEGKNE